MSWHPDEAYDATVLAREEAAQVVTLDEVRDALREAVAQAGSLRTWSRRHAVSETFVNDIIAGRKKPSVPVLAALKINRAYVRFS